MACRTVRRVNANAPRIIGTVMRLSIYGRYLGQTTINSFDYQSAGPSAFPFADQVALVVAWQNIVSTPFANCCVQEWFGYQYTVQVLSDNTSVTQVFAAGLQGNVTAFGLPSFNQVSVQKLSALKGQHGRGRIQMPAVPDVFLNSIGDLRNQLTVGALDTYGQLGHAASLALNSGLSSSYTPVIVTRPKKPAVIPSFAMPWGHYHVQQFLGTQQRRKVRQVV